MRCRWGTLEIQSEEYLLKIPSDSQVSSLSTAAERRSKGIDYLHLRKADPISVLLTKFSKGDRLVRIRISDTGLGSRRKIRENLRSFLHHKIPDKGTGLGLSIS
jgi:signal transduction histidine kinase